MIEVSSLQYQYDKSARLWQPLSFELPAGSVCGLLGKNGVGKTTLLKLLSGLLLPRAGSIRVAGKDPSTRTAEARQQVFFVAESPELPDVDVQSLALLYAPFYPLFSHQSYREYIDVLEIPQRVSFAKLSFGQRRKLAIAFGLATGTPTLLLDEPSNGLDIDSQIVLRKIMVSSIDENRLFLISTHHIREFENIVDTLLMIHNGQCRKELLNRDEDSQGRTQHCEEYYRAFMASTIAKPEGVDHGV